MPARILGSVLAAWLVIVVAPAHAQNHIQIIYPLPGQEIPAVDSTFIFGNTHPEASLQINGKKVAVHKGGGFLAFLPVTLGPFRFELISELGQDVCSSSVEMVVGQLPGTGSGYVSVKSISPSGRTALSATGEFEFELEVRRIFATGNGGRAFCRFERDSVWREMYPEPSRTLDSVFGDQPQSAGAGYVLCRGVLPMADAGDSSRVFYRLEAQSYDSTSGSWTKNVEHDSTSYYVVKMREYPPRVLRLLGRPRIVRTAPGKGYKLVNQPAGIRMVCTGEYPGYYQVRLAGNVTGYVKTSDAALEPTGALPPRGVVKYVVADDLPRQVRIKLEFGDKLPFEMHTDGNLMTVDVYGLVSDTDWIRQNGTQKFIESIWWSQPQDDVYRLNVRWSDKHFWGYAAEYLDDQLVITIKKQPGRSLKGVRIVVDAGHSHDVGAVGPTGLAEKDANLWIAHELRKMLEARGADVLMTRAGHEDRDLYERVDMALKQDADILVSIHNNALPDGINPFSHNGTSVYYYFNQARPLADAIHAELVRRTGLSDHGLYYGNLALTRISECPAVLVECAFMMIPEQEDLLKTDKFQRKCAKAILKGIVEYLKDE